MCANIPKKNPRETNAVCIYVALLYLFSREMLPLPFPFASLVQLEAVLLAAMFPMLFPFKIMYFTLSFSCVLNLCVFPFSFVSNSIPLNVVVSFSSSLITLPFGGIGGGR